MPSMSFQHVGKFPIIAQYTQNSTGALLGFPGHNTLCTQVIALRYCIVINTIIFCGGRGPLCVYFTALFKVWYSGMDNGQILTQLSSI